MPGVLFYMLGVLALSDVLFYMLGVPAHAW
jgi:hypothetical protein